MKPLPILLAALALAPLSADRRPALPTVYEVAVLGTIVPARLLRAIAIVESSERDNATGDDGVSIGRYQLHERFHAERARLYGEYDPRDPLAAGIIAARILEANYRQLGDWTLAIGAYQRGVTGVRRMGVNKTYIAKVFTALKEIKNGY